MLQKPNRHILIVTVVVIIGSAVSLIRHYFLPSNIELLYSHQTQASHVSTAAPRSEDRIITLHIAGAIQSAGVYRVPSQFRLLDLIQEAGGLSPNAAPDTLNLARPLKDGQRILIPYFVEKNTAAVPRSAQVQSNATHSQVQINHANAKTLQRLPGIGPAMAERIIEYRTLHGAFERLSDLQNVKGIGPKLIQKLQNRIIL